MARFASAIEVMTLGEISVMWPEASISTTRLSRPGGRCSAWNARLSSRAVAGDESPHYGLPQIVANEIGKNRRSVGAVTFKWLK